MAAQAYHKRDLYTDLTKKAEEITMARFLARRAIRAQWQAQGLKVNLIASSELAKAAMAYFDAHPELVDEARVWLARCANLSSGARRRRR